MDITMLTETKLCSGCHAKTCFGYLVFASSVASPCQGRVALIWQMTHTHWTLEGMCMLSANSISTTLVSGSQQWVLLGTYIVPKDKPDMELNVLEMEASWHPLLPIIIIIMGDLNPSLSDTSNAHSIAIATTMQHLGVYNIFHCFHKKGCRHMQYCTLFNAIAAAATMHWLMQPCMYAPFAWSFHPSSNWITGKSSKNSTAQTSAHTDATFTTGHAYQPLH